MDDRISLHAFTLKNERITQSAKPEECMRFYNQTVFSRYERPQFLPFLKEGVSLGGLR
jgi:hypothetical protein